MSPGETVVILGGVVAGQGQISIGWLIALTWACAFAGDLSGYALGRRAGREALLRLGGRVKLTPERLGHVERLLHRHGTKLLLPGRFVGAVRALAPVVAGVTRMPAARFAAIELLAAGVWSAAFALLGDFFWDSFDQAPRLAKNATLAFTAVIVAGIAIVVIIGKLRARQPSRPADGGAGQSPTGPRGGDEPSRSGKVSGSETVSAEGETLGRAEGSHLGLTARAATIAPHPAGPPAGIDGSVPTQAWRRRFQRSCRETPSGSVRRARCLPTTSVARAARDRADAPFGGGDLRARCPPARKAGLRRRAARVRE